MKFFSKHVLIKIDNCKKPLVMSHVVKIVEIFTDRKIVRNDQNMNRPRWRANFDHYNKKFLCSLATNLYCPELRLYLQRNESELLQGFRVDKIVCRRKAFRTLLDQIFMLRWPAGDKLFKKDYLGQKYSFLCQNESTKTDASQRIESHKDFNSL